nr:ribonuclease H-like domain-containing protein [Thioalkalivibrio sp.]
MTAAQPLPGALRSRLERLGGRAIEAHGPRSEGRGPGTASPRRLEGPVLVSNRQRAGDAERTAGLARRLGGEVVARHLILVESRLPLETRHGRVRLADSLQPVWPLAATQGSISGIDTETTGLSGGTGTTAFMIGIAQAEPEHVRVRQWLLTGFAGEAAMLVALAEVLAGVDLMLSYNGKSFDLPLLRDRRRLQRGAALPEPPHVDLLHLTRRLFRNAWPDCRLGTAEQRLLGLTREDDLPGSEAPRAWRDYLAGAPADDLERVLRHNALDVLSLLVLGPALARVLRDPAAFAADPVAAAETWNRSGDREQALSVLAGSRDRLDTRGELALAWALRRAGRWTEAAAIWERLARAGCAEAMERLAKYHEHVRRDWSQALVYASRLEEGPEVQRRRRRLVRRLSPGQGRLEF